MKSSIKIICLLLFLTILSLPKAHCGDFFYDGYFITLENDTIHGQIKDYGAKKNGLICIFKNESSETQIAYKPGEIKGYYVKNKLYVSKYIKEKDNSEFAEFLIDGILDLYFIVSQDESNFIIEKENGEQYLITTLRNVATNEDMANVKHQINSKNYGRLKYAMQDYQPIFSQIDNTNPSNRKSMSKLVMDYHRGITGNSSYVTYSKDKPMQIYAGVSTGINISNISFTGIDISDYLIKAEHPSDLNLKYGIDISICAPSLSERLSADFILEKSRLNLTYTYDEDFESIFNFDFSFLTTGLCLNYIIIQKKLTISPYAGLFVMNIIDLVQTREIEIGYHRNFLLTNDFFLTLSSGINLNIPLSEKRNILLRSTAGYYYGISSFESNIVLGSYYKNISLGLTLLKGLTKK